MYAFHAQAVNPSVAELLVAVPVWDATTCQEVGEYAPLLTEISRN